MRVFYRRDVPRNAGVRFFTVTFRRRRLSQDLRDDGKQGLGLPLHPDVVVMDTVHRPFAIVADEVIRRDDHQSLHAVCLQILDGEVLIAGSLGRMSVVKGSVNENVIFC